jgi:nucleotide-binding universal stress UspA family protein
MNAIERPGPSRGTTILADAGRVVVGADGSPAGHNAVRTAAAYAAAHGTALRIVHAFNWLPTMHPVPGGAAGRILAAAVVLAAEVAPEITADARLVEGAATSALLRESRFATLLVVGDSAMQALVPGGDQIEQLAGRARCAVLVVRAGTPPDGPVLACVDPSSPVAGVVLDAAFDEAARRGAELVVLHAGEPGARTADEETRQLDLLRALITPRENTSGQPARAALVHGNPPDALVLASHGAQLVVVGTAGDHPYAGLPGAVTQGLLHHSPAPVLVVHSLPAQPPLQGDHR